MRREELEKMIMESYGVSPDFPWARDGEAAAFRHPENGKWFALVMKVRRESLGLDGEEFVDIVNLKCEPFMGDDFGNAAGTSAGGGTGIFPAYHMNKKHWISVVLDGGVEAGLVQELVHASFMLTS